MCDAEWIVAEWVLDLALSVALVFVDNVINIEAGASLLVPLVFGGDQSFAEFLAVFRARIVGDTKRSGRMNEV